MSKVHVRFDTTKGRTPFVKGGKLKTRSTRALSQDITDVLKTKMLEGLEKEVAFRVRQQYFFVTRAYFSALVDGVKSMINGKLVPVQVDSESVETPTATVVTSKGRRYRFKGVSRRVRGHESFAARVEVVARLRYGGAKGKGGNSAANKVRNSATKETIGFTVNWKKLSPRYARRHPKSTHFFYKRWSEDAKSARVAFNSLVDDWAEKANRLGSYNKSTFKYNYDKASGTLTTQFKISTPALDPQFDFLREAFLSGNPNVNIPAMDGHRGYGIAKAEAMRPFLSHFAAELGKRWRTALKNISDTPIEDVVAADSAAATDDGIKATGGSLKLAQFFNKILVKSKGGR